jgi:asparagine synthase (glutamine-hydrolysing)
MCGFLGVIDKSPVPLDVFCDALQKMHHRGPDDQGIVLLEHDQLNSYALPRSHSGVIEHLPSLPSNVQSPVLLGHVRLTIIDLTIGGHQPFLSEDGRYALIFNGEIYNYKELREELHLQCITSSDTEVLLKSYIALGPQCVERFIGMWAFVIYDRLNHSVFASRDPFGIKPLYYCNAGDRFVFASEIKALLPFVSAKPNNAVIYNYLINGIKDYDRNTFFDNVKQLEPGQNLWRHAEGLKLQEYIDLSKTEQRHAIDLRKSFHDSMKLHMRSDVPFGVALSGGIDSTIIAAVIATEFPEVQCGYFSGVFPGIDKDTASQQLVDESPFIDVTVQRYGLRSHKVTPTLEDVRQNLAQCIWHLDEPARTIAVLLYSAIYRKAAEEGVKVLLGGQGADETFAGYIDCFAPYLLDLLRQGNWIRLFNEIRCIRQGPDPLIVQHFIKHILATLFSRFPLSARRTYRQNRINSWNIFHPDFIRNHIGDDLFVQFPDRDGGLDMLLWRSFRLKLRDYLDHEDKLSMMSSVESRVPFLSAPFVLAGLGIPGNQKISHGMRKFVLREAFKDLIPESILNRTDKTGYTSPEGQWVKSLTVSIQKCLAHPNAFTRSFINPDAVERMIEDIQADVMSESHRLFRIWSLEIWYRLFIKGETPESLTREIV